MKKIVTNENKNLLLPEQILSNTQKKNNNYIYNVRRFGYSIYVYIYFCLFVVYYSV